MVFLREKFRNIFVLILTLVFSGCATVADLEILNDHASTKKIRETAAILTKSATVIGVNQAPKQINTTNANILYKEIKINKDRKVSFETLPYALQELQYIEQLSRSLKKK